MSWTCYHDANPTLDRFVTRGAVFLKFKSATAFIPKGAIFAVILMKCEIVIIQQTSLFAFE